MPIKEISIRNTVFREKPEEPQFNPSYEAPKGSLLERLHSSRNLIQEKAFGNISAFNFNRDVFNGGHWNDLTTKARGLFLDNTTGRIVARGFEKFFGYKEKQFNSEEFLKNTLKFPVSAYVKYNGFLGILGFDDNGFLFCSKSTVGGDFAQWFERIFRKHEHNESALLEHMRKNNVGLVFEVIDPVNDPHIVEYNDERIVLLDAISLDEKFKDISYDELDAIAHEFNFMVKKKERSFDDWSSLKEFLDYEESNMLDHKEGYVLVDANGYHFKLKGAWYKFWKWMRTIKDQIAHGRNVNASGMNAEATLFCGWAQRKGREYCEAHDIISLRNEYENEKD